MAEIIDRVELSHNQRVELDNARERNVPTGCLR
jgi:hypothetical protein